MATTALRSLASSRSSTATRCARLDLAAVGLGRDAVRRQPAGHEVGVALGERVDDPGALELRQPGREPGEPVGLGGQLDDLQPQAGAPERPAVRAQRRGRPAARAELLLDVGDHAVVRRRRRAQHRDAVGQPLEHLRQPAVVRAEVVAPVGDAVRLVDDQQPDPLGEQRQHRVAELRVVEPLRADEQQVDRVVGEQRADLVPRVAVRRVDRVRADPEPLRRGDLVAHQREQRRDDQRRARRRARAAARWRGSRRPTCPSPSAARTAPARGRPTRSRTASSWCGRKDASGPASACSSSVARASTVATSVIVNHSRRCPGSLAPHDR